MTDKGPETRLIPIRTFSGNTARLDAELAKGLLAADGIDSEIPNEAAADTFPFLNVQLFVREEDSERAAEILSGLMETATDTFQSDEAEEPDAD
jgi:hypothetical protein